MEWLDLVAPSAAIFAFFLGIALLVQSIRHGRAIRRLEESLASGGQAAEEVSLERVKQLQTRMSAASAASAAPGGRSAAKVAGIVAVGVLVLALVAGGVWFVVLREDSESGPSGADATSGSTSTGAASAPSAAPPPPTPAVDVGSVGNPPPLADKSQFTVAVFNASGVNGAAGNQVAPAIRAEGYQVGRIDDSPDGRDDLARSVVMYPEGKRNVARNLARDLGITRAPPLDGITEEQLDGADVVVLIGTDITATP